MAICNGTEPNKSEQPDLQEDKTVSLIVTVVVIQDEAYIHVRIDPKPNSRDTMNSRLPDHPYQRLLWVQPVLKGTCLLVPVTNIQTSQ